MTKDPSLQKIELQDNSDGTIRVSTSCLLNIVVEQAEHKGERFLMLLNSSRKKKGSIEYGPLGGSYICSRKGLEELQAMGARGFEGADCNKMRFKIAARKLDDFEKWFKLGIGTEARTRKEAVMQIIRKELVEEEPILPADLINSEAIQIFPAGFVRQRSRSDRTGKEYVLTERFFEIFDVIFSPELKRAVKEIEKNNACVRLASFTEIEAQAFGVHDEAQQEAQERIAATALIAALRSQIEVRISALIAVQLKHPESGSTLLVNCSPDGGEGYSLPASYVDVGIHENVTRYEDSAKGAGTRYFTLPRCQLKPFRDDFKKRMETHRTEPFATLHRVCTTPVNGTPYLVKGLPMDAVSFHLGKVGWAFAKDQYGNENQCLVHIYEGKIERSRVDAALLREHKDKSKWIHNMQASSLVSRNWLTAFAFDQEAHSGIKNWNLLANVVFAGKRLRSALENYMNEVSPTAPGVVSKYQTFKYMHTYSKASDWHKQLHQIKSEEPGEGTLPWRWTNDITWYDPPFWTDDVVRQNTRKSESGTGWADPEDIGEAGVYFNFSGGGPENTKAGSMARLSFQGKSEQEHEKKQSKLKARIAKSVKVNSTDKSVKIKLDKLRNPLDGTNNVQVFPRNPRERTGIRGRGVLGKWGPNYVADPVITRDHPKVEGLFQVLVLCRDIPKEALDEKATETKWYSLPGGYTETAHETIPPTLKRMMNNQMTVASNAEDSRGGKVADIDGLLEAMRASDRELGGIGAVESGTRMVNFQQFLYHGYITAPENTDNAWIQSRVQHYHLTKALGNHVEITRPGATYGDGMLHWMTIPAADHRGEQQSPLCAHHHQLLKAAHEVLFKKYDAFLKRAKKGLKPSELHESRSRRNFLRKSRQAQGNLDAADLKEPEVVRALLIIDVQKDFVLDQGEGALGVPGGHTIVPTINYLRSKKFNHVFLCQDWHPT
eukprot:g1470.t1